MKKAVSMFILLLVVTGTVFAEGPTNGEVKKSAPCFALADGPGKPIDQKTIGKWSLITYTNLQTKSLETLFESKSAPQKLAYSLKFLNPPGAKSDFNQEKKKYCCKHITIKKGQLVCGENGDRNSYSDTYGGLTGAKNRGHIQYEQ